MADEEQTILLKSPGMGRLGAFITLLKMCIGAAITAMPFCFKISGYIGTTFALILTSFTVITTLRFLVQVKKSVLNGRQDLTYPDLAREVLGETGFVIVLACLLFSQWGTCCAYHIFISRSLDGFLRQQFPAYATAVLESDETIGKSVADIPNETATSEPKLIGSYYFLLPILFLPLFYFFCYITQKNVKHLSKFAAFGLFFEVGTLLVIVVTSFLTQCIEKSGVVSTEKVCGDDFDPIHIETLPYTLGIVAFGLGCTFAALPIERAMKKPDDYIPTVVLIQIVSCAFLFLFGFSGYFIFGSATHAVITLNVHGSVGIIVKMGLSFALAASYPVQMYPVIQWTTSFINTQFGDHEEEKREKYKLGAIIIALFVTTSIASVFPDFGSALSLLGGVGFAGSILIAPFLHMKVFPDSPITDKLQLVWLFVFGIFLLIAGTLENLDAITSGKYI